MIFRFSTSLTARRLFTTVITNNVPPSLEAKVGSGLLQKADHPLCVIKETIHKYFHDNHTDADQKPLFATFDSLHPKVSTVQNFDDLLIPPDHVSRSMSDTFYYDKDTLLRTHTSAHQTELLAAGNTSFLCSGDCYRRDEIDASHYPVFHQMEGFKVFDKGTSDEAVVADLKNTLEGLVSVLFKGADTRWVDAYFPFTEPSLELEVYFNNDWLEVLGSGVVRTEIMSHCGYEQRPAWAFGLGLERLAMVLFGIPDIRLFWSQDTRFSSQFSAQSFTKGTTFVPFSKYPVCVKDIAFWLDDESCLHENDLCVIVREHAGDIVESVSRTDRFEHPKTKKVSHCYRVNYRSMEVTLTNEEVNAMHQKVRDTIEAMPGIELR